MAVAQEGTPIRNKEDCASALDLGLNCMGVSLGEECAGRTLVRAAMDYLRGS